MVRGGKCWSAAGQWGGESLQGLSEFSLRALGAAGPGEPSEGGRALPSRKGRKEASPRDWETN